MIVIMGCGAMGGGQFTGYLTGIDHTKEKCEEPAPQ